jgi:hypothetical protein
MKLHEQQEYLIVLIQELEKQEDKSLFNNFVVLMEDLLKTKYLLRHYLTYPITAAQYDELITYAETLLGIDTSSGRTKHTSGVQSANTLEDLFNEFDAANNIDQIYMLEKQLDKNPSQEEAINIAYKLLEIIKKGHVVWDMYGED